MDIFFKNDGSYGQSAVGIPVLVDYTPVGFVREVNADMVTCSLFDKFVGKRVAGAASGNKRTGHMLRIYRYEMMGGITWE